MRVTRESSPNARRPRALLLTSAALLGVGALAAWVGAWTFAAYVSATAALPLTRSHRQHSAGSALTYGSFGWHLLGIMPALSGLSLGGPYGGPPALFAVALAANVARLVALRSDATKRWLDLAE